MKSIPISDMISICVKQHTLLEKNAELFNLKMSYLAQGSDSTVKTFETQYTVVPEHHSIVVDRWQDGKRLIILADDGYRSLIVTGSGAEIDCFQSSICADLTKIAYISNNFIDLGYTPDNLKAFMVAYDLDNRTCSEILQKKGRNTFGRYLLPIASKSHSSMSHSDWVKLIKSVIEK